MTSKQVLNYEFRYNGKIEKQCDFLECKNKEFTIISKKEPISPVGRS